MGILNLIYYGDQASKKSKKQQQDYVIFEKTFYLNDLREETKYKLFELIPQIEDLLNVNLTVDFNSLDLKSQQNYLHIPLSHFNDIYFLFGLPIDLECIVAYKGKVYIDQQKDLSVNRATIEPPKLEVCLNNERLLYYTFGKKDAPSFIINKTYEYYIELIRHLKSKFKWLDQKKIELQLEYEVLDYKENERLSQLMAMKKQASNLYKKDKYDWIAKHGSEHLKLLYNLNYEEECELAYVTERAKIDFPGWVIDYNHQILYNTRSAPSREAYFIKENLVKEGYYAEIVWVKKGFNAIVDESEAVVVFNYLNQYRLYKRCAAK